MIFKTNSKSSPPDLALTIRNLQSVTLLSFSRNFEFGYLKMDYSYLGLSDGYVHVKSMTDPTYQVKFFTYQDMPVTHIRWCSNT
jgi:hypothetical protein